MILLKQILQELNGRYANICRFILDPNGKLYRIEVDHYHAYKDLFQNEYNKIDFSKLSLTDKVILIYKHFAIKKYVRGGKIEHTFYIEFSLLNNEQKRALLHMIVDNNIEFVTIDQIKNDKFYITKGMKSEEFFDEYL